MMAAMKFGFVVPWADAADIGELAAVAELHGWDALFVWEPVWGSMRGSPWRLPPVARAGFVSARC